MYHYRIQRDPANEFTMGDTELDLSFPRIDLLVEHYQEDAGGLPTTLTMPCPNSTRQFFNYKMTFLKKKLEIDRPELKFAKVIGSGQFGEVWVGMIKDQRVAIKTNKEDNMLAVTEFFYEGEIMVNFNHDHIVKLLGVSTETAPMCIVLEFLDKGSLLDHLRSRGRAVISPADLLRYSAEMGSAMAYLEQNRYLHRDLAARNVLVGSDDHCKLADFGLSVQLDPGHDHYIAPEGSKFPIKWTAPESLKTNYFTIKSDVWSFGILLWEMYSYGRSPYSKINHKDIAKELEEGTRMEAPSGCPDYIFQMMRDTWLEEPDDRPSFADICVRIEQAPEDCRATTSPEEPPPTD
jgi:serine/threonine protein kinase